MPQSRRLLFCFVLFLQGLHSTRFCQKKKKTTDYFNTVTQQQLLLMPLKGTVLFGTQIFLLLLLLFSNLYLFALNHTNGTKSQRFTLFRRHRFLLVNTDTASARSSKGREVDLPRDRIITHVSAANRVWECASQRKKAEVGNDTQ